MADIITPSPPAGRAPRLTPEQLAAAASVREYWARRATASTGIESPARGDAASVATLDRARAASGPA